MTGYEPSSRPGTDRPYRRDSPRETAREGSAEVGPEGSTEVGPSGASPRVVSRIERIADRQLEPGYFRKRTMEGSVSEALAERVRREDRFLLLLGADERIAEVDDPAVLDRRDELLGFGFSGTYTREEMEHYLAVPFEDVFSPGDFPVGHLRNVTLRGDVQGDALGYEMASYALGKLYEMGHRVMVTCLWSQEGTPGTTAYAERVGAERIAEYDEYFDDRTCPSCGFSGDCTCTFAFFKWVLE